MDNPSMHTREFAGKVIVVLPSGHQEAMSLDQAETLEHAIGATTQDMRVEGDWDLARELIQFAHDWCDLGTINRNSITKNIHDHYYHRVLFKMKYYWVRRSRGLYTYTAAIEKEEGGHAFHEITVDH
tara:strand:- start:8024 stop:8404 length:381 start_codon:yes stop_codon:yes gene_type:complete